MENIYGELLHPLAEAIWRHVPVRAYQSRGIEVQTQSDLKSFCEKIQNTRSDAIRFVWIQANDIPGMNAYATMGNIKNAPVYIAVVARDGMPLYQVGFMLELVVLYATHLGIYSNITATNSQRRPIQKLLKLPRQETLYTVLPLGYPEKPVQVKLPGYMDVSRVPSRKPWASLFMDKDFNTPLYPQYAGEYQPVLSAVHRAPSILNKQPWRILKTEGQFHFFKTTEKISRVSDFDAQKIDLGVAQCHFELMARKQNLPGHWDDTQKPDHVTIPPLLSYVSTWVCI